MLYTKKEIIEKTKSANYVEIYLLRDTSHRIHSDNIVSDVDFETIEDLPYNIKGQVDVDIEIMDKEDYSNSVIANTSVTWEDFGWEDYEKVAVIILNEQTLKSEL